MLRRSRWLLVVLSLVAVNCGGDSPTAPSTPTIAQVGGVWTSTATLTGVTGGECVGNLFQGFVGTVSASTATVTQTGSTLTGTITSPDTGISCSYSGTAGSNTVVLNLTTCQVDTAQIECGGGVLRHIQLVAGSATGTVSGNTMSGTAVETWNVFTEGLSPGSLLGAVSVGVLTVNSTFQMTR